MHLHRVDTLLRSNSTGRVSPTQSRRGSAAEARDSQNCDAQQPKFARHDQPVP